MEELYNQLREKHQLPSYAELDTEFEISSLDDDFSILRNIRKKMSEKVEFIANTLKEVIHPEASYISMHESSHFSDDEKRRVAEIYRKLMFTLRHALELYIDDSEELNAKFIRELYADWMKQKKEILFFMRKLKDSWNKETAEIESGKGYFG